MQEAPLLYYTAKPQSGGIWGCALRHCTSDPLDSRRFVEACRAYKRTHSTLSGHAAVVRSEILGMPFFYLFNFFDISKCNHRFRLQAQKTIDVTDLSWPKTIHYRF